MTTAEQRVRKAEKLVAKWSGLATRRSASAARMIARGNTDRALELSAQAEAAARHAKKAFQVIEKYAPIAGMTRAADVIAARAAARQAEQAAKSQTMTAKKKAKAPPRAALAQRPTDTVLNLARRGQIDQRQRRAAEHYRDAFEIVISLGMKGTLDPDKTGGGSGHGQPPPQEALLAAEVLNGAAKLLGLLDGSIVAEVVGHGRSVEEVARQRYGAEGRIPKDKLALVGARLRDSLTVLADEWFPARGGRSIRSTMTPDARPVIRGDAQENAISRGRVAHAGATGVRFSDEPSLPRRSRGDLRTKR